MRKTKLCTSCKEEIDAKATKCPHCQAKQTSGCLKIVLAIFLGFIFLCFISVCITSMRTGDGASAVSSSGTASSDTNAPVVHKNNWSFSERKDDFDGTELKFCIIDANEYLKAGFSSTRPEIRIRQRNKKSKEVIIIAKGVVFGHLGADDKVRLKFDDDQPFSVGYDEAANGSSDTIFLRSSSKIIEKLKTTKKLVIELPIFMESGQRVSFDIEGYEEVCKF